MTHRCRYGASVLLIVALTAAGACSSAQHTSGTPTAERSRGAAVADQLYAVGRETVTYVDRSRPTPHNGSFAGAPQRTLSTLVFYPALGRLDLLAHEGAAPARDGGPYPLFVFVHGLTGLPVVYSRLLTWVAEHGYVVAAPTEPLSQRNAPGGATLLDVQHQPGDVSFVITSVLRDSAARSGVLSGLVDARHVAVGGHSLGAITTFMVAYHSCCADPRIGAAVSLAGAAILGPSGRFFAGAPVPLLMLHGDHDPLVLYPLGTATFQRAKPPKDLVTLIGGDHSEPYLGASPWFDVVERTTVDFLDAYVGGRRAVGLTRLGRDATIPGVAHVDLAPH